MAWNITLQQDCDAYCNLIDAKRVPWTVFVSAASCLGHFDIWDIVVLTAFPNKDALENNLHGNSIPASTLCLYWPWWSLDYIFSIDPGDPLVIAVRKRLLVCCLVSALWCCLCFFLMQSWMQSRAVRIITQLIEYLTLYMFCMCIEHVQRGEYCSYK